MDDDWLEFLDRLAGLVYRSSYPLIKATYDDAEVFYLAFHCENYEV